MTIDGLNAYKQKLKAKRQRDKWKRLALESIALLREHREWHVCRTTVDDIQSWRLRRDKLVDGTANADLKDTNGGPAK